MAVHSLFAPLGRVELALYSLQSVTYNVFFHPLRRFPGPKLNAMVRIPQTLFELSGRAQEHILDLHMRYGPVVRINPDTLAISHPEAPTALRGHRKAGQAEHSKDPVAQAMNRQNIIGANREDHTRFRKTLSNGFSAKSMMEQQPTIKKYVDLLLSRLRERSGRVQPVDMVAWYNFATFDIIGDLAFGEPFGCLETSAYHPWVSLIFDAIKQLAFARNLNKYPFSKILRRFVIPPAIASKYKEHMDYAQVKVRKRLSTETDRPDFIGKMVQGRDGKVTNMSLEELGSNAAILVIAGSETTATLLSAVTFFLATNPETLAKATEEVRSQFASDEEFDLLNTQNLKYMEACLEESLRMYPPVPSGQARKIAKGGDSIAGFYIPEDTLVETWQWALYRNPAYFTRPNEFIPDRWLGDEQFKNDRLDAVEPFSQGPRNCIGRNLAYAEMRLILARMLWNFDVKLADESRKWYEESNVYILWQKKPLYMHLSLREKV
ncbi:Isotrichodermin C-15 hydroxylase [Xylariaceae sp. FL0016]|nr:Isotrichodermin C-15 hydroxylase [Xylariaceae sp. FL0016]